MRKTIEIPTPSLVESVRCKLCKAIIELPKQTPIVGQDQDAADYLAGFYKGIMTHMTKAHSKMRPMTVMWSAMFSEFLILSMFDLELSPALKLQFDVKRVQLLKVTQSKAPQVELDGQAMRAHFEEDNLCKSLEERGFHLATGFLPEESLIIKP